MAPQLPLALRFPPDQRFDTFLGERGLLDPVAEAARGARSDWLLLSGPSGSGKTHLLLAACAEAGLHARAPRYVPLRDTAGRVEAALAGAEQADLAAVDDVDAVLGSRDAEIALFDFHNRARASGCAVVYAAASAAAALPAVLPDLRSRLAQCTQLTLPPLDEAARRSVLQHRARRRGLQLDEGVLDFLFRRVGRDLTSLTALLDRIDRESLAAQRRVTIPFLRTLL